MISPKDFSHRDLSSHQGSHFDPKFQIWPSRILAGSFLHQLEGDSLVMYDEHRLTEHSDRA